MHATMPRFKELRRCVAAAGLLINLSISIRADHPGPAHRPTGKPEQKLSGIYFNARGHHAIRNEVGSYIEPISEVLKTLGKPLSVTIVNDTNKCESTYVWKQGDVRLEVGSGCIFQKVDSKDVMMGHGAYSVEVWGKRHHDFIGVTGRGLALGDPMAKAKRLYGNRCECERYTSGTGTQITHGEHYEYSLRYQWGDRVELDIDADAHGRVVHMLLIGDLD